MDVVSENKVGKWQLRSEGVLGKEELKLSFCLIIPMHDPTSLVFSSNDTPICNIFAVLDLCNLITATVARDTYGRENIKLSIFEAGFGWGLFLLYFFFIPSSVKMLESKISERR